jgi:phage-related protein
MFSFIFDAIDSVVGQITSFASQIQDQVYSPIDGFVNEVLNGVWRGNGADAFVQEMRQVVMPEVSNLVAAIAGGGGMGGGAFTDLVKQAVGIIGELDDAISSIGNAIGDVFDSIF